MVSGAHEAIDGVAGLLDLRDGRVVIAFPGGVKHAVLEVVIEQTGRHSLQGAVCPSLLVLQDGAGAGSWGEVDATQQLGVERDDDGGDRHQDRAY